MMYWVYRTTEGRKIEKLQNPWGRIHNSSWSIFREVFAHFIYGGASFLILENFI